MWIDPTEAAARVVLAIVSVLICISNYLVLMDGLPPLSKPFWLGRYLQGCLLFNLIAVLQFVLVNYHIRVKKAAMARKKAKMVPEGPGTPRRDGPSKAVLVSSSNEVWSWIDIMARWLYPLAMAAFVLYMQYLWQPAGAPMMEKFKAFINNGVEDTMS